MRKEYNLRSGIKRVREYNPKNNQPSKKQKQSHEIVNQKEYMWDSFNVFEPQNSKTSFGQDFSKDESHNSHSSNNNMEIDGDMDDKRDWVSATRVKNYLMNDPVIDWFGLYYLDLGFGNLQANNANKSKPFLMEKNIKKQETQTEMSKLNILFEMGNKFEKEITQYLKNKYPNDVEIMSLGNKDDDCNNAMKQMQMGTPIILQMPLYNIMNKTYGVSDIVIRSDWINKLFDVPVISEEEETAKAKNLNGNYHYRVIDIKWTTMYLCANGKTIRNSHLFPAYKGQLAIYNAALGLMQGYTPNEAYILAKSWNINGGKFEGHNCFTQLGCIDYSGFDNKYIKQTMDAVKWIRNVRHNGSQWLLTNPKIPELYPNMCNKYDAPYHNIKKDLSEQINELTQIWMIGVKNRKIAHKNNIYSWDNENCSSENIGIKGKKIGPIVDKIISINRDDGNMILPQKIINNTANWKQKHQSDFYIDFEYANCSLYNKEINLKNSKNDSQLVFLKGIGYEKNGQWKYKSFVANELNRNGENEIVNKFVSFVKSKTDTPRFFHWSHAEKSVFEMLNRKYNNQWNKWKKTITWIDMYKVFVDEPIVIKGAKKFALKEIATAMYNNGMIDSKWPNNIGNGFDAMNNAIKYYRNINSGIDDDTMDSIIDYNEIDCKVIWEIVSYLRNHHVE